MARQPRYVLPGQVQHVIQRGNNRAAVFARDDDYEFYLVGLMEASSTYEVGVHAYVLMPNHVHLLLTPARAAGISKVMQSVGGRYAQYVNSTYRRTGTVWGGRYRSTVIDPDRYLLPCMRYVELNPVRAGCVSRPSEYRWSSYRCNAQGEKNSLVAPHPAYLRLGDTPKLRREAYQALFRSNLDEQTLADIRNCTNKGWVLGGDEFRVRLAALVKRRVQPLPRGGDRRSARTRSTKASDPFVFSDAARACAIEKLDEPHH